MTDAGVIFAVACLVLLVPPFTVAVGWFWIRRNSQPIKARRPGLVVFTDVVLLLFMIIVCAQRIAGDSYPCYLNLWSGYVGTILLCNAYLMRCWLLYFDYMLTQERVKHYKDAELDPDTFVVKYRHWSNQGFLVRVLSLVSFVLLLPTAAITAANKEDIVDGRGDNCEKSWADALIAVYVGIYVAIFCALAWNLRQVVDGFFVKEELKITGIVAALAVVPWLLFNTRFESTNEDVFPFSTLVLVIAISAALITSTVWPLYRSLYHPTAAASNLNVPERIDTLRGLLSYEPGYESFKRFLATEFSVENLLFYTEVEYYRAQVASLPAGSGELVRLAHNIYAKYTALGAPFEVNLPGNVVQRLKGDMKELYKVSARQLPPMDEDEAKASNESLPTRAMTSVRGSDAIALKSVRASGSASAADASESAAAAAAAANPSALGGGGNNGNFYDPPTIFDAASKEVYHLMETDSYQRYVLKPEYTELVTQYEETVATVQVFVEMNKI